MASFQMSVRAALRASCTAGSMVLALASVVAAPTSWAQTYPARPVRLIVPSSSGSGADTVGRIVAGRLSESLGQQVVIDPRAGAGGNLAAEIVAGASPDGYTLLMGSPTHVINTSLGRKLNYDLVRDFAPITLITTTPYIIVVNPAVPVNSIKALIALAREKPGQLNYASSGIGNATHLAGELLNNMAGIKLFHVPYKGAGPAAVDLLAGQVQIMFANFTTTLPFVRSKRMRALAVTSERRASAAPEIPTMIEAGVPGYVVSSWFGIFAPVKTPRSIIDRLNGEFAKATGASDIRDRLAREGASTTSSTPGQMSAFIKAEIAKWHKVVVAARISVD